MRLWTISILVLVVVLGCAEDDSREYGPFPPGDSRGAGGDGGAGDTLAGDPLAGDPLAGDPLVGDPLAGDPLAGDPAAGDTGACHSYGFGGDAVTIVQVGSLPAMTGGTIALGAYDVVEAQTTGGMTGTIRSTWDFETESIMQILEQITLGGTPPEPTPRTLTWGTSGTTLTRQQICGGTTEFNNEYSVRDIVEGTFLDIRQGGLMFTYQLRE